MFESLYPEFGKENVDKVRRELTARESTVPSYIELLAELCLRQGPSNHGLHLTGLSSLKTKAAHKTRPAGEANRWTDSAL